jgi:F420-non-reducing hydrogenase large subunit
MLRELMYMGHYIHSHALQLFVLSGPDLLLGITSDVAKRNIMGILEAAPDTAKKALRLRSLGQKILEIIGGRGVHPVTAIPGGITFSIDGQRDKLAKYCREALNLVKEVAGIIKEAVFRLRDSEQEMFEKAAIDKSYYLGTVKEGKLNLYEGILRAMDSNGKIFAEFDASEYGNYIEERAMPYSYMKETYLKTPDGPKLYRVKSLARINCADGMETELAQAEFEKFCQEFGHPCHKTIAFHYARLIELLYACEKAVELIEDDKIMGDTQTPIPSQTQTVPVNAIGHVEAPRGTLIHDYKIDEHAKIKEANLIVATQQNYAAINKTISQAVERVINESDEVISDWVEFCIRCYDPCLSCATHSIRRMPLEISIFKEGELIRHIRRLLG